MDMHLPKIIDEATYTYVYVHIHVQVHTCAPIKQEKTQLTGDIPAITSSLLPEYVCKEPISPLSGVGVEHSIEVLL
jgi:hypothetical protein